MTTFTIKVDISLTDLKKKYRVFFGRPPKEKVTKKDLADWVRDLFAADMDNISIGDEDMDDFGIR